MQKLFMLLIRIYKLIISPLLPSSCRYYPNCSQYALEAIAMHGSARGLLLTAKRLLRCHPWGGHGFDPVPENLNTHKPNHSCKPHQQDHPATKL